MGGRYRVYPEYKESKNYWIGQIPKDWSVSKLGYLIETIVPMRDKPTSLRGETPWIRIEDFDGKYIANSKSGQGVDDSLVRDMHLKVFPVGTVLCTCSCSLGTTAIVAKPLISNQTFIGLIPGDSLSSEYLYYLMQASEEQLTSKSAGAIQKYLSQDEFKALKFGFPSLNEQQKIANFLDHETKKIDTLIEKQQQLIKLLKEKRQAVISHAVTKGLTPDVPMKDSGVEWSAAVPEHWSVVRLKFLVSDDSGIQMGPFGGMLKNLKSLNTGYKLYGQENTISDDFTKGSRWLNAKQYKSLSNYAMSEGDIVLTRKGSLGKARLVQDLPMPGIIDSDTIRVRTNSSLLNNSFLSLLMHDANYITEQIIRTKRGSVLPGLNSDTIANLKLLLPGTIEEQIDLVNEIIRIKKHYEQFLNKCFHKIELLQERRTALISAAVTGKIDVRNWQPPKPSGQSDQTLTNKESFL